MAGQVRHLRRFMYRTSRTARHHPSTGLFGHPVQSNCSFVYLSTFCLTKRKNKPRLRNRSPLAYLAAPLHFYFCSLQLNMQTVQAMICIIHRNMRSLQAMFCNRVWHGNTVLFISPSGISELDCAITKTHTAERSIPTGSEFLQVFFYTRGLGVLPGSTARG